MSPSSFDFYSFFSLDGQFFNIFTLGEEGFQFVSFLVFPRMKRENRVTALSFKNSLSQERIRALVIRYFILLELEIVVPRRGDTVLHPSEGFCAIYVDYFKVGLRLPLFLFLIDILNHYELALPQLAPNVIRTVITFQLFCDYKRVGCFVSLFRRFFLLKSTGFL